jgi:hypothetical protein
VNGCNGMCNIQMSGPGGAVRVSFFKQAYGDALLAKGGSVYVNGIVKKSGGGTKIILSGVQ